MAIPDRDALQAIATAAKQHAELFELPLREQTWRGSSGEFAGTGVGSSLDFQDHRHYLPGDDPRHINWQAYARTGNYTLKLYREEVRPIVEIIFDVSASMFADEEKATRALDLFYFAVAASERAGSAPGVHLVKGPQARRVETASVFTHRWVELADALPGTDAAALPDLSPLPLRAQSLRVYISDLLFTASPDSTLPLLQRGKGRPILLCPFAASEADPGWEGNYEFIDTESATHHDHRVDRPVLNRYLAAYRRHFETWKAACIRARIPLARVPAAGDFVSALKQEAIGVGAVALGN